MVKIENLVPSIKVKTENVFQCGQKNVEQNENGNYSEFPENNSNQSHFNTDAELTGCQEVSPKKSESKSCPKSEKFKVNSHITLKQESALKETKHPVSVSNLPLNITKTVKHETTLLVAPLHPGNVIKVKKETFSNLQSPSVCTESNFNEVVANSCTYNAPVSVKNESDSVPILKLVKTEENVSNSGDLPTGLISKHGLTFSYAANSLGLLGIKPCWVVIDRVDVNKIYDNRTSDLSTFDNNVIDKVSFGRKFRDRMICNSKAQNDLIHDNMAHEGTRDKNMPDDKAHVNMTLRNATESVEISSLVAPFFPNCLIKLEKEEEFLHFPSSPEANHALSHDNKMQNNLICSNNSHGIINTSKRETSPLVAAAFPSGLSKVEKEKYSSHPSSLEVSHDNRNYEHMICDYENHDINIIKREASLLVAPASPSGRIKVEKEKYSSLPLSFKVSHDNGDYGDLICDNKNHNNKPVKREPSVLVAPFFCDRRIKVEKEEEFFSPLLSSEVSHDNKLLENMICGNKIHDNNSVKHETSLIVPFVPDCRIGVAKEEFSSFPSTPKGSPTPSLDNMMPDNITYDNKIHDNIALKYEISTLVAPFLPDSCLKVEKEGKLYSSSSSSELHHALHHDNNMYDNMICENKIDDNKMQGNTACESKIDDSKMQGIRIGDNKILDNNTHDNIICENKINVSNVHDMMTCENLIHDNNVRDIILENKIPDNEMHDNICDNELHVNSGVKLGTSHSVAPSLSDGRTEGEFSGLPSSSEVAHDNKMHDNQICENKNLDMICDTTPNVSKFHCERCRTSFTRKAYLKRHIEYHCEGPPLAVKKATSHARTDGYASRNLQRADGLEEKRPKCKECGKYFSRPDALKKHVKRAHLKPKIKKATIKKPNIVLNCNHCDRSFSTKTSLQSHLQYYRNRLRSQRVCSTCDAAFQDSYSYNRHMRWAHARKQVKIGKCEGCEKVFARFSFLNKHLKRPGINNAEFFALVPAAALNQSTCEFCNKLFAKVEFLKCHLLRRVQKPAQVCRLCCAYFEAPKGLSEHLRLVHQMKERAVGENVASIGGKAMTAIDDCRCHHCGKYFRGKGWLKNHILRRCVSVGSSTGIDKK